MEIMSFRCDERTKDELLFIQTLHETNQSQAIKEAIHAYHQLLNEQKDAKSPIEILKESGYIGSFKGDKNLSTNYKYELGKSLKAKYDKK